MTKARDLANASTALSAVSATELGYLDGVTSAVQTQIDGKQAANANVSTTELGYLDGVTSAIQTQLDAKVSTAGGSTVTASGATVVPVVLKGATSQTGDLLQIQNSSATVLSNVLSDGSLGAKSITISGGGGQYVAGSIYSDTNWGMIFRAKQASPAQAQFKWSSSTDTEYMRIDASGYVSKAALRAPKELWTVSATAATGTIQYDLASQGVLYYTTNSSGNFTLNFRGDSGTTLNSLMNVGDTITASFLATNSTAYYQSTAVTVDGAAATIKWSGGTAPTAGNASAIDAYSYTIIKTANATFTVLCAGPVKYA